MIAIPNMDKPKICGECPLFIDHCCFDGNEWHNGCFSLEREIFEDELADDCPIIEIVTCGDCKHRDPEDKKCDSGMFERQGCIFPVNDDYFCKYGERRAIANKYG